ncbi:MAG: hypothetical protein FJ272_20895, partial [Planctomycetes bacterium]|nr:hypothetical protein [Planctomycetota bacterium]
MTQEVQGLPAPHESLQQVADKLVAAAQAVTASAQTEEDLRIGIEKVLDPLLESIGIETKARYERLGADAKTVYQGRPDAVHGQVIIEYEPPNVFSSERVVEHAHDQLVSYMTAEAEGHKADAVGFASRLVGIGFDGGRIFFVQFSRTAEALDRQAFIRHGPYPFDPESARTFLTYLRAL